MNAAIETRVTSAPDDEDDWIDIEAGTAPILLWREWWQYREVLAFFIGREVRVRYRQTSLGLLWTLLQPVGAMLVFSFFLGHPARLASEGWPYPIFALSGFVLWTFWANSWVSSSYCLPANAHVVNKVYFPRLFLPLAAVGARSVDFALSCVVLVAALLGFGVARWPHPALCIVLLLAFGLALSGGVWLAALNVRHRDAALALPHLLQFGIFLTPVFYSSTMLPPALQQMMAWNPCAILLRAFRDTLAGEAPSGALLLGLGSFLLLFGWAGCRFFQSQEVVLADVV
jgi:lipopolysaccharide transport system permease protein